MRKHNAELRPLIVYLDAGNDTITADEGNDIVFGGDDNDEIWGGEDNRLAGFKMDAANDTEERMAA